MSPKVNRKDRSEQSVVTNFESNGAGQVVRSAGGGNSRGPLPTPFPPDALARMRMLSEMLHKPDEAS